VYTGTTHWYYAANEYSVGTIGGHYNGGADLSAVSIVPGAGALTGEVQLIRIG